MVVINPYCENERIGKEISMNHEPIYQIFAHTAERYSLSTAISCADRQITYKELDERTNRLANFMLLAGASKGSIAAIMAEGVVEVITSVIGILKAGGAFVPLDPRLPDKRLEAMLSLVKPDYLFLESSYASRMREVMARAGVTCKVISLDEGRQPIESCAEMVYLGGYRECEIIEAPSVESNPDDLSYIYFTSGSTGVPKAIAGRLKGIDHFIRWEIQELGLDERVRVSQLLPLTFDGSLRDIFVGLCAGGVVCVPDGREAVMDIRKLIKWLDEERVSLVHCVPSLMRAMLNEGMKKEELESLRQIVMAGEALLPADVGRWKQVYGERVELINLYGTSETTMAKFSYRVREGDEQRPSIPVGKPIDGAKAFLLDSRGKPCPLGMVGEIYIRTPYRSLGYYNQPELTSEAFIQNPFSQDEGDIVYRTGDLGRILDDGNYEYLGRRDQQVKVRGVRVELLEIENLLRAEPKVKDIAVVDQEDAAGYKYLCVYVVLEDGVDAARLRLMLERELPDYMVPSVYIELDEIPRMLNGKVSRGALPKPWQVRKGAKHKYVAPRNTVEEGLSQIWAGLLSMERVGIHDNFFELGGHSLLATQVLSRVREEFGVEIQLRILFELPTLAAFASVVLQAQTEQADADDLTQILAELDQLSEEEAQLLLGDKLSTVVEFENHPVE